MTAKLGLLYVAGAIGAALVISACGDSGPEPTPRRLTPTPTPVTLTPAAGLDFVTPTPTPLPPEEREVVLEFAVGHRAAGDTWEQFHADFDEWRQGLLTCDATALEVTLAQFADRFIDVTEGARGLPRDLIVRALGDSVIEAAEGEEGAVRHLRDSWEPDTPSIFENVDIARSAAAALRNGVDDALGDLQERTGSPSRSQVKTFLSAFQQLSADWDTFHRHYDAFRTEEPQLTSLEVVGRLSGLVDEFRQIVVAVRELPTSDVTGEAVQILEGAAVSEDLAMRRLRGTFEKAEEAPAQAPRDVRDEFAPEPELTEPTGDSDVDASSATAESEAEFVARNPFLFDAFEVEGC